MQLDNFPAEVRSQSGASDTLLLRRAVMLDAKELLEDVPPELAGNAAVTGLSWTSATPLRRLVPHRLRPPRRLMLLLDSEEITPLL